MHLFMRSALAAVLIAAAVQTFTVGVLSDVLPRDVCRPDLRTTWQRTFEPSPTLHINNPNGHVTIATHSLPEIRVIATVQAYVRSYKDRDEAAEYLETLFSVQGEGRLLRISTEPGQRPKRVDLTVNYDVLAPVGTNITLDTTTGNLFLGPGCGDVLVRGHRSDIEIREPLGVVMAATTNGRIDLQDAKRHAKLRTVNGSIRAVFSGERLTANPVNGDIDATLPRPGVRECDLTTTNGAIRIAMHNQCSAEVNAITREGTVTSDFEVVPLTLDTRSSELRGFIGQARTTLLTLSTFSGNITIERSLI